MKKICGIYKITSPQKKVYIGLSLDIHYRWKDYEKLNCKSQSRLYNSLKKYSPEKHKFEILQECTVNQLNELEKYYVDLYQCFNSKFGLNLKDGGGSKGACSEETKRKMSEASKGDKNHQFGKPLSEETKRKKSEASSGEKNHWFGKHHSKETKIKLSETNKGKTATQETKLKMSESRKDKHPSEDTRKKLSEWQIGRKLSPESIAKREATKRVIRQECRTMIF